MLISFQIPATIFSKSPIFYIMDYYTCWASNFLKLMNNHPSDFFPPIKNIYDIIIYLLVHVQKIKYINKNLYGKNHILSLSKWTVFQAL